MSLPFRIIDNGVQDGRLQIAFDQALIDLHKQRRVPDTIRFLRFKPSVLVGRHQAFAHEVKVEDCLADGVEMVRRITGGGAIYLDEGQVGWELVLSRSRLPLGTLADFTKAICEAVASGLSTEFGIDARFRPRNDIEVGGKKLCGTGGFFDGDTLIYQGTVLVDVDPEQLTTYLNVAEAKLQKHDLDTVSSRITTLKALLGTAPAIERVHDALVRGFNEKLGIVAAPQPITADEERLAREYYEDEIGTDEFVFSIDDPRQPQVLEATHSGSGGTIAAFVQAEGPVHGRRIREVLFTGDFFVAPPRFIWDLEAALRGVALADVAGAVDTFFAAHAPDMLTLVADNFKTVLHDAMKAGD